MAEFVKVASTNEIAPGQARLVNVRGKEFALFNIEGNFFGSRTPARTKKVPWPRVTSRATR